MTQLTWHWVDEPVFIPAVNPVPFEERVRIALILGIYQRLVAAISCFDLALIGHLRHGLELHDSRHDGLAWPMPLEIRLVEGHVLDPDSRLVTLELDHAIHHEEWIAMRQEVQDITDVHARLARQETLVFELLHALDQTSDQRLVHTMAGARGDDVG